MRDASSISPVYLRGFQMESCAQISECGSFVAVITRNLLQVHAIEQSLDPNSAAPINYDLAKIFAEHRKLRGWPLPRSEINVSNLQWELLESNTSTKLAISACDDSLHLILIFILSEDQPIIIEADPLGVERLQWLPSSPTESCAYENSTMLVVFTKFGLDLKVYSIVNKKMLFCVPKPLLNEVVVRPGNSGIWSVIASSYYEKNTPQKIIQNDPTSAWPILLHFHSTGTSCSLLASLKLDFIPSSQAQLSWSSSGNWLQIYDTYESLTRHKQVVFNILGIHDKPVDDVVCHDAQPTRTLDYELDETKPHSLSFYSLPMWGNVSSVEYVVVVVSSLHQTVRLRVSDVSRAQKTRLFDLDLATGSIWSHTLKDQNLRYRRLSTVPNVPASGWSKAFTFGSRHLISSDNYVVLFESSLESPISFKVLTVIITNSKLLDVKALKNGFLIYMFTDHIALQNRNGIEIMAFSRLHYTQAKLIDEGGNAVISFVEKSTRGWVWRQKRYKVSAKKKNDPSAQLTKASGSKSSKRPKEDEIPLSTIRGTLGVAGKILGNHNTSSDSLRLGEDITDTFHEQKKRRK